jgi:hypothetical protein
MNYLLPKNTKVRLWFMRPNIDLTFGHISFGKLKRGPLSINALFEVKSLKNGIYTEGSFFIDNYQFQALLIARTFVL